MQQHIAHPYKISWLRWTVLFVGLMTVGFGLALMVRAEVGLGPWDVLHQGISKQIGVSIGLVSILVSAPIMLCWLPLGERPGLGTLANMILVGVALDLFMLVLPTATWLPLQFAQMVAGVIIMGVGSGIYLGVGMGAGPRDGLMMGLVRRTGWSVQLVRTLLELTVLALGWSLDGSVGVGTLGFAFGVGPVLQITLGLMRRYAPRWDAAAPRVRDA
jgi:uncharacterized membrane protein YczE